MRRNSRQFVRNVIIASVIGLITLMIVLFMAVQSLVGEKNIETYTQETAQATVAPKVELSQTLLVLVHKISDKSIEGYDIKNDNMVSKQFTETTRISDAYGNVIPASEIKAGDIVEVESDQNNKQILSASKSQEVHSWKKVSGLMVDQEKSQVSVGGTNYRYNDETMIIKADGTEESLNNIGPYDIATVQVYDNVIWSIVVNESFASINIQDLPTSAGSIEIDYSRMVNFRDVTEPIKVIPGKHKLVIKMEGYEAIIMDITAASGEVYDISLADAKRAYTTVKVLMYNSVSDYQIIIDGKTYAPGEEINLVQGRYKVEVTADGYEKWSRDIQLNNDVYTLRVSLKAIEEQSPEESTAPEENAAVSDTRTVTINTDPEGAKVYIDGAMKGQTPYTVTLTNGNHTILFEKDGYEVYATSIEVGSSDDQSAYLYVLTQN